MNKHSFVALGLLALAACGDDNNNNGNPPDANVVVPPDAGPPGVPALGDQLDRMGRPAINTAANHTFDPDDTTKQAAKDAWNQNADKSTWAADFAADVKASIAILDGIDATCGNQLGADLAVPRYSALAGLLSDDELYVNSASATCSAYLAVEANALGVLVNNDCGGRVMGYDVIQTSYSTLAAGVLSGVDDGIASEAVPSDPAAFPFLADPL
jgi:hypothetical protein